MGYLLKASSPEELVGVRNQVIGDVLRPIRAGDLLAEILVNLDLVEAEMQRYGLENPVGAVVAATAKHATPSGSGTIRRLSGACSKRSRPCQSSSSRWP